MYPLLPIGPFRLSSGGLLLLVAVLLGNWLLARITRTRGGAPLAEQADQVFYPTLIGAVLGARLWYGLFNLDLYGRTPSLFWALRVSDFAWPGALLGGSLLAYGWCRWRNVDWIALADSAALALPVPQALASVGLLLSGEAFGAPAALPWSIPLFGTLRHPTQIYYVLAALFSLCVLLWVARRDPPKGTIFAIAVGLQGCTLLIIEAWRADSLVLPGGLRAAQVVGLAFMLLALLWLRQYVAPAEQTHPLEEDTAESSLPGHV